METRHGKTLVYNILKSDSSSLEILMFSQLDELLHICFYVFALVLRKLTQLSRFCLTLSCEGIGQSGT